MANRYSLLFIVATLLLGWSCSSKSSTAYDPSGDWDVTEEIASYYDAIDLSNYANVIYIDPTTTVPEGEQTGTIDAPYESWEDVTIAENSAYLQKRGTVFEYGQNLEVHEINNLLFWVYGEGEERAVFKGQLSFGDSKNLIVADFEFDGTDDPNPQDAASGIHYGKTNAHVDPDPENLLFLNNYIHGAGNISMLMWGDSFIEPHGPIKGVKIIGNEIGPTYGDGMFLGGASTGAVPSDEDNRYEDMEIGFNNVHDVNEEWHRYEEAMVANGGPFYCSITDTTYSYCPEGHENNNAVYDCLEAGEIPYICGGDAFQVGGTDSLWFHDNIGDRRGTGNKFVGIFGGASHTYPPTDMIFERNVFIGPNTEGSGGNGLYLVAWVGEVVIRNNIFLPPHNSAAIVKNMNPDHLRVYGNVFSGGNGGLLIGGTASDEFGNIEVFNNVFYQNDVFDLSFVISGSPTGFLRNNIFAIPEGGQEYGSILTCPGGFEGSGHNLFSSTYDGMFAGTTVYEMATSDKVGDPLFVDPEEVDFHLQPGSPAIDAGTATGLPDGMKDIDGESVSQGSAPEIGIDEVE